MDVELTDAKLAKTGPHYVQFLRELAIACRAKGLKVSVDVPVPTESNKAWDFEELGIIMDYVCLMAYDEHYAGSDAGSCAAPPVSGNYASANVRSHKPVLQAGRLLVVPAPAPHLWWTAALMIPAGFALLAATFLTDIPRQRSWESGDYLIACFSVFCFWLGGGIVLSVAILTLKKGMRAAFDRVRDRMTVERRTQFTQGEPLDAPLAELQSVLFRRERRVVSRHVSGGRPSTMSWDSWGVWLHLRGGRDFFLLENGSRRAQHSIAVAIADYARVPLETP
jgi:hypothetical protein